MHKINVIVTLLWVAQNAMRNADNALEKLEGFISKMEDFHRLMNLLEVRL
jgi:hypothetical protein